MKRIFVLFALLQASFAFASPSTTELQQKQLDQLILIETNTEGGGGGGGSNASVDTTGGSVPGSATYFGFNVSGNLTGATGTANGLKVDGSAVTQPVSAVSLPLPTGASTSAAQTTGNNSLSSIDGKTPALVTGRVPVDGSGVTQPVSAASLPLPTGASTAANQSTEITALQSINGKITNDYGAAGGGIRTAAQLGNASGAADFGAGSTSAQTVRVVVADDNVIQTAAANGTYSDSWRIDYGDECPCSVGDPVTLGNAAADIHHLHIFDTSGHTLELLVGGNRVFLIPPGGPDAVVDLFIASGDELSVAAIDTTLTSGVLVVTGLE